MGEILKFPAGTAKPGYQRVRRRCGDAGDPNQLDLFLPSVARIDSSDTPVLGTFEEALAADERGDSRAAELYGIAIENQECVADAYCNLGILETRKGRAAKAANCFTTALSHNPRHTEAHYNLGSLYLEANEYRLAQLHFAIAAEVDPDFANAFFNLGLVQSINRDIPAAIASLTRYQSLVSVDEAHLADDLLQRLRQSQATTDRHGAPTRGHESGG